MEFDVVHNGMSGIDENIGDMAGFLKRDGMGGGRFVGVGLEGVRKAVGVGHGGRRYVCD